jgi:hypothetical protein
MRGGQKETIVVDDKAVTLSLYSDGVAWEDVVSVVRARLWYGCRPSTRLLS